MRATRTGRSCLDHAAVLDGVFLPHVSLMPSHLSFDLLSYGRSGLTKPKTSSNTQSTCSSRTYRRTHNTDRDRRRRSCLHWRTQVKVIEVVTDKMAHGWSPEEIHFQHPDLTLAQIHGALTFYYENKASLDEQILRRAREAEQLAGSVSDPVFRQRLLDLKTDF